MDKTYEESSGQLRTRIMSIKQSKYQTYKKSMKIKRIIFGIMLTCNIVMFCIHFIFIVKIINKAQKEGNCGAEVFFYKKNL